MTIKTAKPNVPGVRFFYVTGDSGAEYVVTFIRRAGMRRTTCNCPDFTYRRQLKGSYRACKHIRFVRESLRISNAVPDMTAPLAASVEIARNRKRLHVVDPRVAEEARLMGRTVEDHIRTRLQDSARLADLENRANH